MAAEFYLSVFPHAGKLKVQRSQGTCPWPACQIGTIPIEILLHGGPAHKLTPAFSFFIRCDSQQEIDSYWSTLLEGSNPKVCGGLTAASASLGRSCPRKLAELITRPRTMAALIGMSRLDMSALEAAERED